MTQVSVLIAAYRADYLDAAVRSAMNQTYADLEIVVVDDSSGTEVARVVERCRDERIVYIKNDTNLGPALSYRRAIAEASSDFIGILNDDDVWEPNLVSRLLQALKGHPTATFAFADHWVMRHGERDESESERCASTWKRESLAAGLHQPCQRLALIDKSVPLAIAALFRKAGVEAEPLAADVGGAYDYFLCYLLCRDGGGGVYVPERLASWRTHGHNLTGDPSPERAADSAAVLRRMVNDNRLSEIRADLKLAYGRSMWHVSTRNLMAGRKANALAAARVAIRWCYWRALVLIPLCGLPGGIGARFAKRGALRGN